MIKYYKMCKGLIITDKEIKTVFSEMGINPKMQKKVWERILENPEFFRIVKEEHENMKVGHKIKDEYGEDWYNFRIKNMLRLEAEYIKINAELEKVFKTIKVPEELDRNKKVKKIEERLKEWGVEYNKYVGVDIVTGELLSLNEIFKKELSQILENSNHPNKEIYKDHIVSGLTQQQVADKYSYSSVRGAQKAIKSVKEETVIPALFHLPYK